MTAMSNFWHYRHFCHDFCHGLVTEVILYVCWLFLIAMSLLAQLLGGGYSPTPTGSLYIIIIVVVVVGIFYDISIKRVIPTRQTFVMAKCQKVSEVCQNPKKAIQHKAFPKN
jgi:hypothetical protein